MTADRTRSLLVTGGIGTGKTTVAVEIGFVLESAGYPNAVLDVDWLGWLGPGITGAALQSVIADNLRAVTGRMHREGIRWFVLARAIETPDDLDWIRDAVPDGALDVVALDLDRDTVERRVRSRAVGATTEHDLALVDELAAGSSGVPLRVTNDDRPVRDTALDVLRAAGWPTG